MCVSVCECVCVCFHVLAIGVKIVGRPQARGRIQDKSREERIKGGVEEERMKGGGKGESWRLGEKPHGTTFHGVK